MIVYPPGLTDRQKLEAVYRLREEMRLEHNRQGKLARADWAANRGRWQTYTKLFRHHIGPLNMEQVRLRETIRKTQLSDREWKDLHQPDVERGAVYLALFGNRHDLAQISTLASVSELADLKRIDLAKLRGQVVDPYEDWTTYTKLDTNSRISSLTANSITFADVSKADPLSVSKDFGAGYFGNPLTFNVDFMLTQMPGASAHAGLINLANSAAPAYGDDPIITFYTYLDGAYDPGPPSQRTRLWIMIDDGLTDQEDSYYIALNQQYYITFARAATMDLSIYTDSGRTSLLDMPTVAAGTTAFQYMSNVTSRNQGGGAGGACGGVLSNLDLAAGASGPGITSIDGITSITSVDSIAWASIATINGVG